MKAFFKIFGIVAGIFFLLLVAAVMIVPLVVDPNDYKDRIVTLVENQTGRKLKIQGDIALSVFPWLGLKLGAVELGNAPGFEAPVFAGMEQLHVRVRILPLLARRVEADVVAVRGLAVNLERNREGRTNWEDLMKGKPQEKPGEAKEPGGPGGAEALVIGGLDVKDASVTWSDRISGQRLALTEMVFETSEVSLADPVNVKIGFSVDTGNLGLNGRVETASRVRIDMSQGLYRIEDLKLGADLKGKILDGGSAAIKASGAAAWSARTGKLDLERLKIEAAGFGGKASAVLETSGGGDPDAGKFHLKSLKVDFTMAGKPDPIHASLTGTVMADLKAQKIDVSSLALHGLGMKAAGSLSIQNFSGPDVLFDLAADQIDVDAFLPAKRAAGAPPAPVPDSAARTEALPLLPVDALRKLSLDGKLAVGKLKIANLRLQDIRMQASGKDGLLTLHPVHASLYGGTYSGNVAIDARGRQPRIALDERLAGVQIGQLLADFQGRAPLTGTTGAAMKLTATGLDADAISRTLNGDVGFQLADGSIEGVDILGKICRTLSAIRAGSLKKEDIAAGLLQIVKERVEGGEKKGPERTVFSEMRGSMAFADGVGTNNDLMINSPLLRVKGAGKLDLVNRRLDYQATAALVKSCEGQGGKSFVELANYPIPVAIAGPLDRLEVKPDLTAGILKLIEPRQAEGQPPPAGAPQPRQPQPQPAPQEQKEPRKQLEDAGRDLLQKGLQDLFKKK